MGAAGAMTLPQRALGLEGPPLIAGKMVVVARVDSAEAGGVAEVPGAGVEDLGVMQR